MRYLFPAAMIAGILLLLSALLIHPPGSSAGSSPAASEISVAAKPATAAVAAAPAAPVAPMAAAQHGVAGDAGSSPAAMPAASASSAHMTVAAAQPQPAPAPAPASAAAPPQVAAADAAGDAQQGRQVFRKCQVCHSLEPGKNLVGPSLAGVVGRKAATVPGFAYSDAMKKASVTWDRASLDAYLADPQKFMPGNRMPFPGLKSDHDRSDVIAYLTGGSTATAQVAPAAAAQQATPVVPHAMPDMPDVKYTLRTGIAEGRMVYIGFGGAIDGKVNPMLTAAEGQIVQVTLINGEGAEHDIAFPDQNTKSPRVTGKGASTTIAFRAAKAGEYSYFCSVPGHQLAGMEGRFQVSPKAPVQALAEADISREPSDLPGPLAKRAPQTVRVDLVTSEVEGRLADGTTFGYWTFNGKVPGPFLRVRVGDTIEVHVKNAADSAMIHSVDFHAATGPGGGAAALQTDPGTEKSMTLKMLVPGLYVYHCATPMVSEHIANGMYGMILVEPEEGLPKVDREYYVMQGEIYTDAPFGQHGSQEFSVEKLLIERPEYFVFNGSVGALTKLHPLHAKVGESVRIYFGVGGPNVTSSFHVIGEIFDKVYELGGVTSPPVRGIQTVTVAPGGAVIVEFTPLVPGNYALVDHALTRVERGLAGTLIVEGQPNLEIYNGKITSSGTH